MGHPVMGRTAMAGTVLFNGMTTARTAAVRTVTAARHATTATRSGAVAGEVANGAAELGNAARTDQALDPRAIPAQGDQLLPLRRLVFV